MGIKIDSIGLFENKNKSVKTSLELCRRAAEPCIKYSLTQGRYRTGG